MGSHDAALFRKQREILQRNNKKDGIVFRPSVHYSARYREPLKIALARRGLERGGASSISDRRTRDHRLAGSSTSVRRICLDLPEVLPPGHYDVRFSSPSARTAALEDPAEGSSRILSPWYRSNCISTQNRPRLRLPTQARISSSPIRVPVAE